MKRKNKLVYFGAVVLSIVMISTSATVIMATKGNEIDTGKVKAIFMDVTPTTESIDLTNSLEAQRRPAVLDTDVQVTSEAEDEYEAALGVDPDKDMLLAYTFEEDVTSNIIPWRFSTDQGQTWDPGVYYDIVGTESHPAIDYQGTGKKLAGTLACDPLEVNGAIQYTFLCDDPTNPDTYGLTYIEWGASFPYYDRRIPDVGGYFFTDIPWWYGMIGVVGTRDDPGSVDMPIWNYADYNEEGRGWSSYFGEYGGCENAAVEVDLTNGYYYGVFDYLDGADWDLLVMRGDCHPNPNDPEHPTWFSSIILGDEENTKFPAVGVNEDKVIILAQTDEMGTQDIICYYSSDAGATWQSSMVADSASDDELYPSIVSYGEYATCMFYKNDNLYVCYTEDGGATWDSPVQVNDEDNQVDTEFRNMDLQTGGYCIWTDNRDGDKNLYMDNVGGEPPHPILEIGEIQGGLGKIKTTITNVGDIEATDVHWTIQVTGGILGRIDVFTENNISSIPVGGSFTIETDSFIFGLGALEITVMAECAEAVPSQVQATSEGFVLLVFVVPR
jgi:hypothetical protein